jgi:hypothetical protein
VILLIVVIVESRSSWSPSYAVVCLGRSRFAREAGAEHPAIHPSPPRQRRGRALPEDGCRSTDVLPRALDMV